MAETWNSHPIYAPSSEDFPNYMRVSVPDGNLAAGSTDEVEIETGISIADRQILNILGANQNGLKVNNIDAVADAASSTTAHLATLLQTRTGAFNSDDPEVVMLQDHLWRITSDGTNTQTAIADHSSHYVPETGQPVASPRLVTRSENNLGQQYDDETGHIRYAYEFIDVDMGLFLELAELHADIFLV